ncbi:AAA family ATPase [Pseudomonas citri]|uniref:AAA family ATPase n=1 Tax=Pseudomonas citri TaxID=2978349 RepID=UPI0021B5796D|nr:AAA family ATPase [Pseudomonas citri]
MDVLAISAKKEFGLRERIENYRIALASDGNEAQTRFHVIDEFLIAELDWSKETLRVEPYLAAAGYADYAFFNGSRCKVVLEAKRDEINLCSSEQAEISVIPLNSSAVAGARSGIEQAIRYASKFGAPIGIVTNGRQWIGFLASRADGLAPADGFCVVFPSVEAVIKNWSLFYEFFSDVGLQESRVVSYLREKETGFTPVSANYYRAFDRSFKQTPLMSDLSYAIEELFTTSFIRMSGQSIDVLMDCFVETKASREADVAFEKIVDELLGRVKRLQQIDSTQPEALQNLLEYSVELKTGEFVLLVGNKGAGKTTFLQRFFQKVVPKPTKDQVLFLSVNLLKSEGSEERLADWMSNSLIDQAERALYGSSTPTYDELRGTFWAKYQRLSRGELAPLYKIDRDAFRQKFGEELRQLRLNQPREYLLALLKNSLASRRLLPVLVIDNVDHLSRSIQDSVFQYAIGISSNVASFLVCPVTDTTVWSLSKAGPLQSFSSRAFFLPVPSLKEVFTKRLEILRKNQVMEGHARKRLSGLVGPGWKLEIPHLEYFCATVESIFVATSDVTSIIGKLCNYDVRRSLELAGSILASPWIGLDQLLRLYVARGELTPRRTDLLNALILQKGSLFDEDKHSFITNLFARPAGSVSSPLMALYILRLLINADERAATTRDRFIRISELWTIFSALNIAREIFRYFVDRLFSRGLLEIYDPSEKVISDDTLIRISAAGIAHYRLVFSDNVYLSQMALVTLLETEAVAIEIREEAKRAHPGWMKICRIILTELKASDSRLITVNPTGLFEWVAAVRSDLDSALARVSARNMVRNGSHATSKPYRSKDS